MRILGCWYSNNAIDPKIIRESLAAIQRAQAATEHCSVYVRTCTWHPIEDDPFKNYTTFFRIGVHLGIIIQILKVIYEEERAGNTYDVIAFLEHDVLYPHDYFDRITLALLDHPDLDGVSNLDYIGLNETGWLNVKDRHEPMHQLSLRYMYALSHLEHLVKRCILDGYDLLEPHDKSRLAKISFNGQKPACHVNHSRHFTSHYKIYEEDSGGCTTHAYWGHYLTYYPSEEHSLR